MSEGEISQADLQWRLLDQCSLIRLYNNGFPVEELERQLGGPYALAEIYGEIKFHARKARQYADPRDCWLSLFGEPINR